MITVIYAGLGGLLLVASYVRVSQIKWATKFEMSAGGSAALEQRIRAYDNFITSVRMY